MGRGREFQREVESKAETGVERCRDVERERRRGREEGRGREGEGEREREGEGKRTASEQCNIYIGERVEFQNIQLSNIFIFEDESLAACDRTRRGAFTVRFLWTSERPITHQAITVTR